MEADHLKQTGRLMVQAKAFLQQNDLFPADSALHRLIDGSWRLRIIPSIALALM